jgi:hypothetical protein
VNGGAVKRRRLSTKAAKSQLAAIRGDEPAPQEDEGDEEDDGAVFPILREAVPLALLFLRAVRDGLKENPFSGAPDGVDWGQVESVAHMTATDLDAWSFDVLARMFGTVEKVHLKRWRAAQAKAAKKDK